MILDDEHVCDSECEHSEPEIDDESEVDSEEHICDSDCDHSELESAAESEYESEEPNSDEDDDQEEVVEISENESSADEAQPSDDEEIVVCECDSNCPSDCDGNHHECSSECGCNQSQSESDNESQLINSNNITRTDTNKTNGIHNHAPPVPQQRNIATHNNVPPSPQQRNIENHNNVPPIPQQRTVTRANTLPSNMEILNEISPQSKTSLSHERNNNRLQRNNSQKVPSQKGDILGELKTAIDARVRRTASCRETATDYRKRYAHLSNDGNNSLQEHVSKVDVKERELRRKERRTRLRTLELKREQCLEEVRGGTENNVTDWIYQSTPNEET